MDWKWRGGDGPAQARRRHGERGASVDNEGDPEEQPERERQFSPAPCLIWAPSRGSAMGGCLRHGTQSNTLSGVDAAD
jgi:hypothetical protein